MIKKLYSASRSVFDKTEASDSNALASHVSPHCLESSHRTPKELETSGLLPSHLGYRFIKRCFDIVFSTLVIVIFFLPALMLGAAIRIESPGNPLYIQRRVRAIAQDGSFVTFPMVKFRSMIKDADSQRGQLQTLNEADGPLFKIKDDPRITRIGCFIRKYSLDEMPQFLNVFAGQMSVVGPRPPLPDEVKRYNDIEKRRLAIKPGITCYWQVRGKSDFTFNDMVELDLRYIRERSVSTDIKVIFKTIAVVLKGSGT